MAHLNALVSAEWLADNIDHVKLLDGTWCMPGEAEPLPGQYIPGAQFFDIDEIADLSSPFKHMLPMADVFSAAMSTLGIKNDDHVIVYDRHGFRAAPRVWWTLQMFGHKDVSILNGGLPAWIKAGHEVAGERKLAAPICYQAKPPITKVASQAHVLASIGTSRQILDARSRGRFHGTEPEPRAGLRLGHIPGSYNLPFTELRTPDIKMKDLNAVSALVGACGIDISKPIITTCGSGITAAGLAFALYLLGAEDVSVYDGSWTEWGASDAPITTQD